jgi:hypothetical protein
MTVSYAPGESPRYQANEMRPMLRIANRFLYRSNFRVGDKVHVEYGDGEIIITKQNKI